MTFCKNCGNKLTDEAFMGYCSLNCLGGFSKGQTHPKREEFTSVHPFLSFDYHGIPLYEAKTRIVDDIIESFESGVEEVRLIHGYKHGQAIKAYIWQKNGLHREVRALRPDISFRIQKGSTRGVSLIRF
ncbi:MAG: Smr/MutS family protein [Candidatus Hodarchaeales archaeon]